MKAVTIDEDRIAARMKLVEEHSQAEMDLDLDRTLANVDTSGRVLERLEAAIMNQLYQEASP